MYSMGYTLIVAGKQRFSEVKKLLENKGHVLTRISGSRHIFTKKGFQPISIPVHKGKVKPYYVKQIRKIE